METSPPNKQSGRKPLSTVQTPAVDQVTTRCSRLHDKAVQAAYESKRLRALAKTAARHAERLRTIDMSNARLAKELQASHNSDVHDLNGNIDGDWFSLIELEEMTSDTQDLLCITTQDLASCELTPDITIFISGSQGWQEFDQQAFLDLFFDCDLVDEWAMVLCASSNKRMHALHGNTSVAGKAERASKRAEDQRFKEVDLKINRRVAKATEPPKSSKGKNKAIADGQAYFNTLADQEAKRLAEEDAHKVTTADKFAHERDMAQQRQSAATATIDGDLHHCPWLNVVGGNLKFAMVYVSPDAASDNWYIELAKRLGNIPFLEARMSAAASEAGLVTPVVPHTTLDVTITMTDIFRDLILTCDKPKSDHDRDAPDLVRLTLPLMERLSECPMESMFVHATVGVSYYGFGWPEMPYRTETVVMRLSMTDLLTHMSQRIIGGVDFATDLHTVRSTLERTDDISKCNKFHFTQSTYLHDVVHTGLLTMLLGPQTASMGDLQFQFVRKMLYEQIVRDRPSPSGIYLHGYPVTIHDLFPDVAPEDLTKLMSKTAGFISTAKIGAKSAAKALKSEVGHAMKSAADIVGLHGVFPRQTGKEGIFSAFVKRLGCEPKPRSREMRSTMSFLRHLITHAITESHPEHQHRKLTGPEMVAAAKAHLVSKGFKPESQDYKDYMDGFCSATHLNEADGSRRTGDRVNIRDFMRSHGMNPDVYDSKFFLKAECLGFDALKGVRFITAPPMCIRGWTHGILLEACETYIWAMKGQEVIHTIKKQTPEEWSAVLLDSFETRKYYAETDFTSFESNIDGGMLEEEGQLLFDLAPEDMKQNIADWYYFICHAPIRATNPFYTFFLDPMRKSGEFQTSVGNNICNMLFLSYIFLPILYPQLHLGPINFRSPDHDKDHCERWEQAYNLWFHSSFFMFEGDDGLVHLGHQPTEADEAWVKQAIEFLGVRLKFAYNAEGSKLNFCGTTVLSIGGGKFAKVVDALSLLANATTLFDAVTDDSGLKVSLKAYGKVCSYGMLYANIPIVSVFCREAVEFYRRQEMVADTIRELKAECETLHVTPGMYLRTVAAVQGVAMEGHYSDTLDQMMVNTRLLTKVREVVSELGYFARDISDDVANQIIGGTLTLNAFTMLPIGKLVNDMSDGLRNKIRIALNCETMQYTRNFVESCENKIITAFRRARECGAKTVHVDIPEIRHIMNGRVAHDKTLEVVLDDARTRANLRAQVVIDDRSSMAFFKTWRDVLTGLPYASMSTIFTSMPVLIAGSVMCGYIGLPILGVLTVLFGAVGFLLLLPFNGFSIWKTIPKTVQLMCIAPIFYFGLVSWQAMVAYDKGRRSYIGMKTTFTNRMRYIMLLSHNLFRGHMKYSLLSKTPYGYEWYHLTLQTDQGPAHIATIAALPADVINGLFNAAVRANVIVLPVEQPVPVPIAGSETIINEMCNEYPDVPFIALCETSDTKKQAMCFYCGDSSTTYYEDGGEG